MTRTQARRAGHGAGGTAPAVPPAAQPFRRRVLRRRKDQWAAWAFLLPVTAYLLLFYAYPLYNNIDLSLKNYTVQSFVQGGAPFTGFANYLAAIMATAVVASIPAAILLVIAQRHVAAGVTAGAIKD